jgi:polar amino acid transport system substrate-binding protein
MLAGGVLNVLGRISLAVLFLWSAAGQARTLHLCMTDREFLPISSPYFTAPGQYLVQQAIERQGDKTVFAAVPWRRCIEGLHHGVYDGAIGMAYAENFRAFMRFPLKDGRPDTGKALGDLVYVAARLKGSPADWDGQRFLNLQHPAIYNAPSLLVDEKMHSLGQGGANTGLGEDQMLTMLTAGRADIAIGRKTVLDALAASEAFRDRIEVLPVPFVLADSYLAFRGDFQEPEPDYAEHVWAEIGRLLASPDWPETAHRLLAIRQP